MEPACSWLPWLCASEAASAASETPERGEELPSVSLRVEVSRREADRPRLLQAHAYTSEGWAEGTVLRLRVDDAGSLDPGDAPVRERTMTVPADGLLLFHWYEWPRNGPARDFLSTVTVEWNDDRVSVVLQQLYG